VRGVHVRAKGIGPGRESLPFHVETPGRYKVRITAVDFEGNRARLKRKVKIG
jgi:hypothetical protein